MQVKFEKNYNAVARFSELVLNKLLNISNK